MYFMLEHFRDHTGKLTGAWTIGTLTWVAEATTVVGFIGAALGAAAGLMLVLIRWDDFTKTESYRKIRSWFGRK